ncbi:MAG: DUF502 domain-containing protein [Thermoguttaceae bacterium]|nr:DUF502 domain-containing protein [Thermoguttaceae bacterium]MDW8077496.1 DUF502 domain-containing protein [Thermoguttaceae bacterium]
MDHPVDGLISPGEPVGLSPDRGKERSYLAQLFHPVRVAMLRGLGVILPPLVTLIVLIWAIQVVTYYVFEPVRVAARSVIIWLVQDIRQEEDFLKRSSLPAPGGIAGETAILDGVMYVRLPDGDYVPKTVYDRVVQGGVAKKELISGKMVYEHYVDLVYLQPWKAAVTFLCVFVLLLYFVGKLMAAEIGRFVYTQLDAALIRLPLIRTVYSAAKQVSNFLLSRPRVTASRVVAVEWPRKGSWALGFVTSEGMRDICDAASEPILTVLIATSPMPMTGFTVQVRKSETIDLGLSLEEAFQFILSCGVVVPPSQATTTVLPGPPVVEHIPAAEAPSPVAG